MSSSLSKVPLNVRLPRLRQLMSDVHAVLIPTADAHNSEYIASCDKRREFISGFTGSAGTAVVTHHEALLFTDTRYTLQAQMELDSNVWTLMSGPKVPPLMEWLTEHFSRPAESSAGVETSATAQPMSTLENSAVAGNVTIAEDTAVPSGVVRIAVDPSTISYAEWKSYREYFLLRNIHLVPMGRNLVDAVWEDRPARPNQLLRILPPNFTGMFWFEKVRRVWDALRRRGCDMLLVTALDEVAWLLNLRGADIPFNPVFFAYVLVTLDDGVHLFVDNYKLRSTPGIVDHLTSPKVKTYLHDYQEVAHVMQKLLDTSMENESSENDPTANQNMPGLAPSTHSNPAPSSGSSEDDAVNKKRSLVWCDASSPYSLVSIVEKKRRYVAPSPIALMKMVKTTEEVNGIKKAHVQDAVAVCRYLHYLEEAVDREVITEVSGAEKLDAFRAEEADFVSLSFPTISAFGSNGALCHYRAQASTDKRITRDSLYLVDSGGQYATGTTDITRTVHLGNPTEEERRHFTLVLKGHIQLCRLVFPDGTKGSALDSHARVPLWRIGLTFGHGTGHGVGAFLNVHEGPCKFTSSVASCNPEEGLRANTIITIEPGYYREGHYGIRIENIVQVTAEPLSCATGSENSTASLPPGFLRFEPITFVPIQTRLIMKSLLSQEELQWVNDYHQMCRHVLAPCLLERNFTALHDWLLAETQPI